jgi:CHAD domain-containing protein
MVKAKEIEGLDCGARASLGMRLVLLTRLEEMCEHREAALHSQGEDGIHDMRVASRRLRSALRDFRTYLRGGRRLGEAHAELKRLADTLGEVRDEDVAAGSLEKMKAEAPEEARAGLELFAADRRARRERAHAALAPELEAESFEAARGKIAAAFERATEPRKKDDGGGEQSFAEMGREVILRSWDELRGRGADIYRPLKSKRLHKVRIAAKRLRYALELFCACFDGLKELAHELAELQKALGNLHDCDEWMRECGKYLSRFDSRAEDVESAEAKERRAAAFLLLEHFVRRRDEEYAEALAIWRRLGHEGFGERLVGSLVEAPADEDKDGAEAAGEAEAEDDGEQACVPA